MATAMARWAAHGGPPAHSPLARQTDSRIVAGTRVPPSAHPPQPTAATRWWRAQVAAGRAPAVQAPLARGVHKGNAPSWSVAEATPQPAARGRHAGDTGADSTRCVVTPAATAAAVDRPTATVGPPSFAARAAAAAAAAACANRRAVCLAVGAAAGTRPPPSPLTIWCGRARRRHCRFRLHRCCQPLAPLPRPWCAVTGSTDGECHAPPALAAMRAAPVAGRTCAGTPQQRCDACERLPDGCM